MTAFLIGCAALFVFWAIGRGYVTVPPALLAKWTRIGGAIAAFGLAGLLMLRGRIDMAMLVAWGGMWLLGVGPFALPNLNARTTRAPGAVSTVRSVLIEMRLDHDTGEMTGQVLEGPHAGQELDALDFAALAALARRCASADPDGLRLLEAYLDRRRPGWREDAQFDAHPRGSDHGDRAASGRMTPDEAYQILGLAPGADEGQVRRAHRSLMKKLHPDQGGSNWLASRVNEAKDVLLQGLSGRHR